MQLEMIKKTDGAIECIRQTKELEGVLSVVFDHQIAKTEAKIDYAGPFISPEVWYAVTSFLRWTQKEFKGESQARLFIDTVENKWVAWAFPQEASTGMTTHELDNEEAKAQRAALPNTAKLVLFGTVHHHCTGGAFQSGTDSANEQGQDGLHITMGKMESKMHDMDARLYITGQKYKPNLCVFWDIGDQARAIIPEDLWGKVADHQMCSPIEVPFPEQWKKNMIKVESRFSHVYQGGMGYGAGFGSSYNGPVWKDRVRAGATEVTEDMKSFHIEDAHALQIAQMIVDDALINMMIRISKRKSVDIDDIAKDLVKHKDLWMGIPGKTWRSEDGKTANNGNGKKGKKNKKGKGNIYIVVKETGPTGDRYKVKNIETNIVLISEYYTYEGANRNCQELNELRKGMVVSDEDPSGPFIVVSGGIGGYNVVDRRDRNDNGISYVDYDTASKKCRENNEAFQKAGNTTKSEVELELDWFPTECTDNKWHAEHWDTGYMDQEAFVTEQACDLRCNFLHNHPDILKDEVEKERKKMLTPGLPVTGGSRANGADEPIWDSTQGQWVQPGMGLE